MKAPLVLAFLLAAMPLQAFAAGESDGNATPTETTSPKKLNCKPGEVVKTVTKNGKQTKECVKQQDGLLDDEELYQQGRALAKEGEYEWALSVLEQVKDKNQPRVLNYIGYSHRKAGRIETGIGYYRQALALNPDFVLAREYLGEGYVAAGRVDLAMIELEEIRNRCGEACEEYKDLADAIAGKAED